MEARRTDADGGVAWTVLTLLRAATGHLTGRGGQSPRLDAELLLARVLDVDRVRLYVAHDMPVGDAARRGYRELIRRRAAGEPTAYILGEREFHGLPFRVDGRVLIPRPETEHLVDEALSWLVRRGLPAPRVADVCTGSGCIAVSVAVEVPGAHVVATDRSKDALAVAEDNAQTLAPGAGIAFRHGDLLAALDGQAPFDLLLSNPPYIPDSEIAALDTDVRDFEPRAALASGQSAVTFHRRLLREGPAWIVPGGAMMMELPAGGAEVLEPDLLSDWSGRWKIVRDYAGIPRVLEVFVPGT